jgi:acrylyl-CoA reductase (NADPH)
MRETFHALLLDSTAEGLVAAVRELPIEALPPGEVHVGVEYSSVNYKDALILAGRGYVATSYPMVPGIDLAGTVLGSSVPQFTIGDRVVLNGAGLGESRWGGYAELASVNADSLVRLPDGISTRDAMAIGTAGLAAALAVIAIEARGVEPSAGPVLVTGAAGGVGTIATALLAARGYRVTASAGRLSSHGYLRQLGAAVTVDRLPATRLEEPLGPERWSAAIDTAGGEVLPRILREMQYGGVVVATGFVAGMTLQTHLAPFLLRAVELVGVNTSSCPTSKRRAAWQLLSESLPLGVISTTAETISLDAVPVVAGRILQGQIRGRVVVDVAHG